MEDDMKLHGSNEQYSGICRGTSSNPSLAWKKKVFKNK